VAPQEQPTGKEFPGRGLVDLPELTPDATIARTQAGLSFPVRHGKEGAACRPRYLRSGDVGAYNDGAGMNEVAKMAAFIQHNMPTIEPGSLSAQDSYDVATFIHGKLHAVFNHAYASY
jgi:thiosulfate dehydrogenase